MRKKIGLITIALLLVSPLIGILLFHLFIQLFVGEYTTVFMTEIFSFISLLVPILSCFIFYLSFSPKEK